MSIVTSSSYKVVYLNLDRRRCSMCTGSSNLRAAGNSDARAYSIYLGRLCDLLYLEVQEARIQHLPHL